MNELGPKFFTRDNGQSKIERIEKLEVSNATLSAELEQLKKDYASLATRQVLIIEKLQECTVRMTGFRNSARGLEERINEDYDEFKLFRRENEREIKETASTARVLEKDMYSLKDHVNAMDDLLRGMLKLPSREEQRKAQRAKVTKT